MVRRRTAVFIVLAFSVWAILATGMAGYYYLRFEDVLKAFQEIESSIIEVDLLIDYGNGTETWHNRTELIAGSTAFDALQTVTRDVEVDPYGVMIFITSIDGIGGEENSEWFWFWDYWDDDKSEWGNTMEACNQYILHPDDIIKFEFTKWYGS